MYLEESRKLLRKLKVNNEIKFIKENGDASYYELKDKVFGDIRILEIKDK